MWLCLQWAIGKEVVGVRDVVVVVGTTIQHFSALTSHVH